jgi:CRISPR-associated protein Csd1
MILQALYDYYNRSETLPREGWVRRGIEYVIVLDESGRCLNIEYIAETKKGKSVPAERLVPAIGKQALKHTNSGNDANLLWDNASFVFGSGNKGKLKITSFIAAINEWLGDCDDNGISSVLSFCQTLAENPKSVAPLLEQFGIRDDFRGRDPVLAFRLADDIEFIHARPKVRSAIDNRIAARSSEAKTRGTCLITGLTDTPIALNETVIKGVWGGHTAGTNILSFNERAFESYGKHKRGGENAPISLRASFAYTTALNHLLATQRQRIQVGDASTVFWADHPHDLETMIPDLFGEPPRHDPDRGTAALKAIYTAVHTGKFNVGDAQDRFHVLGLAPNAARLSIRFWETAPAADLARRIHRHFEGLKIVRGPNDPIHLSLFRLLTACAVQGKADNIPPNLGGDVMRAILEDLPYPATLLSAAVQRCRAEQRVTYSRAAIIKGWLNRANQQPNQTLPEKEFRPMLDPENPNAAYRLGRLFATLEKIQEEAIPDLNATIRDRFYGAASGTPVAVFPSLLRLKNHHVGKLNTGRRVQMEQFLGEIIGGLADFPRNLPLPEQGRFALGYYHQRQAFFTKSEPQSETANDQEQPQ